MSARLSNSRALRLEIAESRLHILLVVAIGMAALLALFLVHLRGYTLAALCLLPCVAALVWRCRRHSLAGCVLTWCRGRWLLRCGGREKAVEVLPASLVFTGGIYLVWREPPRGRRRRAWLFADCAQRDQLRRLRVRLRLQG